MKTHHNPPQHNIPEAHSILIAGYDLEFHEFTFDDHQVSVDQILRSGGYNPTLDHRLVELTFPGTKSWDGDETIYLEPDQIRHFIVGRSDRLFAFAIDDIPYEAPFSELGEPQLRALSGVGEDKVLVLTQEGEADKDLSSGDMVSFEGKRVERLYSREATVTVCLNNEEKFELPRASYLFSKLIALLGVPVGYILSYVSADGKLMPFKDGDTLDLFDGMQIFSHANCGGAS